VTAAGMHVAFGAASRHAVVQAHANAIAAGGTSIVTPRMRPEISDIYFGAVFFDVDGHRIEVKTDAH
jgi:predicted lactoylglutathione lyase